MYLPFILVVVSLIGPFSTSEVIDLEAKFEPNLLNTAIYLLDLSQQVSTVAINYQVRLEL